MSDLDRQLRRDIVEVGRRMYSRGMIAAADGNISILTDEGKIYITPSGVCKGDLEQADIIVTNRSGEQIEGIGRASSELDMHLAIYDVRPDVHAVVHAHPPYATGFAAAGVPLSPALLSEIVLTLGCVPLTEYATPTTHELADILRKHAVDHDGLLLANHGAVTLGRDAMSTYFKMETLEHYAKINLVTRVLGSEKPIPQDAVGKLLDLRRKAGEQPGDPYCGRPPSKTDKISLSRQELVDLMTEVLEANRK